MPDETRVLEPEEWTRRDELALQFMLALVEGDTAQGVEHPPGVLALKAYQFADGFLAVRDEENRGEPPAREPLDEQDRDEP